jgi:hypothetical protein
MTDNALCPGPCPISATCARYVDLSKIDFADLWQVNVMPDYDFFEHRCKNFVKKEG